MTTVSLFVVAWVILLGQPTSFSAGLRGFFVRLVTPFERLADLIPVIHTNRTLEHHNAALREENARLSQQLRELQHAQAENEQFRALLEIKKAAPWRTVGARVIGRDASSWWQSLQIDRGSADGVRVNQPVVSATGLIGKTISVSEHQSRVLLLLDPNCKAGAVLQSAREPGIVSGPQGALAREPRLQMTFVDRATSVKLGDNVYTSGLGGVFPKGILIGTVTGADLDPQSGMYQNVELKPAADFRRVDEVMVIVE